MMVTKNVFICSHPCMYRCSVIQNFDGSVVSLQETVLACAEQVQLITVEQRAGAAAGDAGHNLKSAAINTGQDVAGLCEKGWTGHRMHP